MEFAFDRQQQRIRRTAAKLFSDRSPLTRLRDLDRAKELDAALWQECIGLEWPALTIGAEYGGIGLGLVEAVAVIEQAGYQAVATPLLSNFCAIQLIAAAGSPRECEQYLPRLATGEITATLGLTGPDGSALMPDAEAAALLVAIGDDRARIRPSNHVRVERAATIDVSRSYGRVTPTATTDLPSHGTAAEGLAAAEVLLAAELVGVAQRALDLTVGYVKERYAFGHPIGAFQGISHRCAEMLRLTEESRSLTYYAAWVANGDPVRLMAASSMAKAIAATAARKVTAMAIQAHGAIGFTWEADLHWLFKRAYADAAQLGSSDFHWRNVAVSRAMSTQLT